MIDKDTDDVIKEFESLTEAAKYLNKSNHSYISQCINNKTKYAYGYKWRKEIEQ